jgi:hypothetical protein
LEKEPFSGYFKVRHKAANQIFALKNPKFEDPKKDSVIIEHKIKVFLTLHQPNIIRRIQFFSEERSSDCQGG